ncbi:uncharacterized protein WM294_000951 [Sarcoramphus papa]
MWAHFSSFSGFLRMASRPSGVSTNCTAQLGVICKFTEGALHPTVYGIEEDIKQYRSPYGTSRDTTSRTELRSACIPACVPLPGCCLGDPPIREAVDIKQFGRSLFSLPLDKIPSLSLGRIPGMWTQVMALHLLSGILMESLGGNAWLLLWRPTFNDYWNCTVSLMHSWHGNFPPRMSPGCLCSFQHLDLHLCPLLIFHALPFTYEEVDCFPSAPQLEPRWRVLMVAIPNCIRSVVMTVGPDIHNFHRFFSNVLPIKTNV